MPIYCQTQGVNWDSLEKEFVEAELRFGEKSVGLKAMSNVYNVGYNELLKYSNKNNWRHKRKVYLETYKDKNKLIKFTARSLRVGEINDDILSVRIIKEKIETLKIASKLNKILNAKLKESIIRDSKNPKNIIECNLSLLEINAIARANKENLDVIERCSNIKVEQDKDNPEEIIVRMGNYTL